MAERVPHISVCICTFQRPALLQRLLARLQHQETDGRCTYSVVIVDNDEAESAAPVARAFASMSAMPVDYFVEPRQNIALARNLAVQNSVGDFIAFIDDDEFPIDRWLVTLFNACQEYAVDGVLGPVLPHFDEKPPQWVVDGKFYDRATYPTGYVIDWRKGRTGNVLLKASLFADDNNPFRPEFRTGEDQDLFRRLIERGHRFIWCNEAVAYEVVPSIRWRRSFVLRRAMLRGAIEPVQPTFGVRDVARSAAAAFAYTIALPMALVLGQSKFMPLLYKLTYHMGVLFALVGIQPVKDPYVTS